MNNWKEKIKQIFKFSLVGILNTAICLGIYYFLLFCGVNYLIAYTFGFLGSVINSFCFNKKFVFVQKQEQRVIVLFIKVFLSYLFSFGFSLLLMYILVNVLRIPSVIAPILKMIVVIPINFVLNKFWAFKDKL